MKTKLTVILVALSLGSFAQTIRRVNNNPGVTGTNVYSTIQAAHDAAVTGDILYIEPSPTAYSGLTSTKQLTILGPGYYLNSATNPNTLIGSIILTAGSAGSILMGLQSDVNSGVEIKYVSNITVKRCKIGFVQLDRPTNTQSYSNIIITQCVAGVIDDSVNPSPVGTVSAIQISNNIIPNGIFLNSQFSGSIFSNTHLGYNNWSVSNFTISNNIWSKFSVSYSLNGSNNTVSNNVASESQFGTTNGNLANVNMLTVFVADPTGTSTPAGYTDDSRYQIKAGSPTIGAGFGGTDCGAFAGSSPYVLSGIPPYPTITKFLNSAVGNSTTPLSVTISTQSNN